MKLRDVTCDPRFYHCPRQSLAQERVGNMVDMIFNVIEICILLDSPFRINEAAYWKKKKSQEFQRRKARYSLEIGNNLIARAFSRLRLKGWKAIEAGAKMRVCRHHRSLVTFFPFLFFLLSVRRIELSSVWVEYPVVCPFTQEAHKFSFECQNQSL